MSVPFDTPPTAASETPLEEMLAAFQAQELCSTLDVQLAQLLVRRGELEGDEAIAVTLATMFTSRARREGHSALALAQLRSLAAHSPVPDTVKQASLDWWRDTLQASAVVGDGSGAQPLVLRDALLQFSRFFNAERRIAERVTAMCARGDRAGEDATGAHGIPAFSIVTGGPGTGKTTLVARRLLELRRDLPDLRVALAAPTGKAAARLTESIAQRLAALATEGAEATAADPTAAQAPAADAPPPTEARTVHRLLGYSPRTDRYRFNAANPLLDDLVIVDEASMVDVLMLDALLDALTPTARIMLVGDHQQLASVDAGDALGALCEHALALPPEAPLHRAVTVLDTSWRFVQQPAIGALAAGILQGDSRAVLRVTADSALPDVQRLDAGDRVESLLEPLANRLRAVLDATSPETMLTALESFRVLAPEREGRWGVDGINLGIERWLSAHGYAAVDSWYHGRPVLVTANDYGLGLFNGDIGVVWRDSRGVTVHFRDSTGVIRGFAPTRLPATETAWAMTVHKSQGSEFDDVLVVIPERESRVMGRELLYTAVTRARQRVFIAGSEGAVSAAVSRRAQRTSGLPEQLARAQTRGRT